MDLKLAMHQCQCCYPYLQLVKKHFTVRWQADPVPILVWNDHAVPGKAYGIHLQSTEVRFQAVSNQNGVGFNEA